MDESFDALIDKYRVKGVLFDTNLLLLLAIGIYRQDRIKTFKRTIKYTLSDFKLVAAIFDRFDRRVTTPNILTETDNLARQLPREEHRDVASILAVLVDRLFEQYEPSVQAAHQKWFPSLGLADCVTVSIKQDLLVVTDDVRLYNVLASMKRAAININHIRTLD
jgi:hypothetical protein